MAMESTPLGRANYKGDNEMKVKVQFIKNDTQEDNRQFETDEDVENVEFLEEFVPHNNNKEHVNGFVDTFYPNAVDCLIALYHNKYQEMLTKTQQELKAMRVWEEISKEMKESFFQFEPAQIRHKFRELRQRYFSANDAEAIASFDDFHQLHEIYQDKRKDTLSLSKNVTNHSKSVVQYADEIFFQEDTSENESQFLSDSETNRVTEKDSKFIKGMTPIKNKHVDSCQEEFSITCHTGVKRNHYGVEDNMLPTTTTRKRFKADDSCKALPILKSSLNSSSPHEVITSQFTKLDSPTEAIEPEFSLSDYNQAQERRHQEKMELLRESLRLQERAIEVQKKLVDELIKHF